MTPPAENTRAQAPSAAAVDVERVRADFPILQRSMRGKPLVYLDSAASAQKPAVVIDALARFYSDGYANIHRGVYQLSEEATQLYEGAREKVRALINAGESREIIFARGTTEGINLVANSYGGMAVGEDDEILLTHLEHHSNIVPWQLLAERRGARLNVVPIDDTGDVDMAEFAARLTPRVKIVAVAHVSNALGTVNPIREMIRLAKANGSVVLLDGAQAVPHMRVDVRELDCDFYVFSGHKLYGPTGIGVLYGRAELLEAMPPFQGGGDMIRSVSFEETLYNEIPHKFEAGTPDIAGAVGLAAAIDYLNGIGFEAIEAHGRELLDYGTRLLQDVPGLRLIGTASEKVAVLSFVMDGAHPHDVGTILDREGIAVRAGHHCAQPVMERFGIPATTRASLGVYNRSSDLDTLVAGLIEIRRMFGL
jgi:cysteine desulfurase/selenocysteine lyase